MKKNIYDNKNDQPDVVKLLNDLPKIQTSENFEFNLMTRIQNGNFKPEDKKLHSFSLFGFLKPALVVAVTSVIAFFVINLQDTDYHNALFSEPQLRKEVLNQPDSQLEKLEFYVSNEEGGASEEKLDETTDGYKVVLNDNDVISKEKIEFPFEDKSFDLDTRLNRNYTGQNPASPGVLAGTGSNRFNFEGFYTRIPPNQKAVDSLRQLRDSLYQEYLKKQLNSK